MRGKGLAALLLCSLLLSGCTAAAEGNTSFRNETRLSIEALWIDESEDLLVNGPLQPGSAVSVDFPGDAELHAVRFFTASGDLILLEGIPLPPGQTVALSFSGALSDQAGDLS